MTDENLEDDYDSSITQIETKITEESSITSTASDEAISDLTEVQTEETTEEPSNLSTASDITVKYTEVLMYVSISFMKI